MTRFISFSVWFASLRVLAAAFVAPDLRGLACALAMAIVACSLAAMLTALEPGNTKLESTSAKVAAPLIGTLLTVLAFGPSALLLAGAIWFGSAWAAWNLNRLARGVQLRHPHLSSP